MSRPPEETGYLPPRDYLAGGLFTPGTRTPRPELRAEWAAATARALLFEGVALDTLSACVQAVEPASRLPEGWRGARERLIELASKTGHPLLGQLLREAANVTRGPDEFGAVLLHLRRVQQLAAFDQVLGKATAREKAE